MRRSEAAVAAIAGLLEAYTIAAVNDKVIRQALSWGWSDSEDAVQLAAATNAGADDLVTRNPREFHEGIVHVVQPDALPALLSDLSRE